MIVKRLSALLVVGLPILYGGCGGDSLTLPSEGEPATIRVADNNNQIGRVGTQLGLPLVVQVMDTRNRPVAGATVDFTVGDATSGGSANPPTTTTDANGMASSDITLGTRVGPVTGLARVRVPEGTVPVQTEFSATALPSNANGIAAVSGDSQSGPVGTALPAPLVVQITDGFGNPIPNITVAWSVTGGGSVSETSTQTGENGQASVTRTLGSTAGTQTTLAAAERLAGSPVTFTHIAGAGSASRIVKVSGDNQRGAPGSELPNPLVVQLLDAQNNPIVERAVAWVVGAGDGSANPETSTTDGEGRASTRWTLGSAPGRNTLNAVVSGLSPVGFTANGNRASSTTNITSIQPGQSTVNQDVTVAFSVTGSGGTPSGSVTVSGESVAQPCTSSLSSGSGSCVIRFTAPGNHRVTATYGGDANFDGSSDDDNHQVNAPNAAPTAEFSPPSCIAGQACQFNDGSSDTDGNVVAWQWEFGDGGASSDEDPAHTYVSAGTYNVKLTVRDNDNATDDVTHQVTVSAAPPANTPPTAVNDNYATPAGTPLAVGIADGLLNNDSDPDQDRFTLTVENVDEPDEGLLVWDTDGSFDYFPGSTAPGTVVTFTYRVRDSQGAHSNDATVSITIQ